MNILIADDDRISLRLLEKHLYIWNYNVVKASDGLQAWNILKSKNSPDIAILDWNMPGLEGIEVCKRVRDSESNSSKYIIILTSRNEKEDIAKGLDYGADDYIEKPFNKIELKARLNAGKRILNLQKSLHLKIDELTDALDHIKTLQGILPICMHCHSIRSDNEAWEKIESYLTKNTDAHFSHGLCPKCLDKYYPQVSQRS